MPFFVGMSIRNKTWKYWHLQMVSETGECQRNVNHALLRALEYIFLKELSKPLTHWTPEQSILADLELNSEPFGLWKGQAGENPQCLYAWGLCLLLAHER